MRDLHSDLESGRQVIVSGRAMTADEAEREQAQTEGRTVTGLIDRFKKSGECRLKTNQMKAMECLLGNRLLADIERADCLDYLEQNTTGKSSATFNRWRAGIHRLLNYAVELGWRNDNPATGIKLKREDNRRDHIIEKEEQKALQQACDAHDEQLGIIFSLAMTCGARVGELTGLQWRHIDLKRGTARLGEGTTKNGKARTLVIVGDALERLKAFSKVQSIKKDALVFTSGSGGMYLATKEFRDAADSIGLTDVVLHSARHTWATRMARVPGMTLVMLRDAGGWKSLAMVQRYAHEMTDDLEAKMRIMLEAHE